MPFSSTDIASLTGGFSQQTMLQQQQAAMLTQQFGGYSPNSMAHPVASTGEQFSGMLMQNMSQMGMSAMGSQRLNGMGWGIAAPFTQTGQFMMGQMAYGAQQQQMLDSNLRQSYRFPNSFGGRGFSGTDTALIGSSLRQASHQRGPGGESASFEELGQLASNMGRMGMAEGVRSVKDFNEKFKTMLSTVKTIATELGTSLEEAQKVMASLKGTGIFKGQGQFTSLMRQGALAGNMSIAEMSSAAMMGAQISRSVGGLGKSGAYAGVHTLSNIGAATQAGVMSEEDIYNATGLTGAEGRQAMAQNMMSTDAHFFSGQLGRRALAAMAGKNGQLDLSAMRTFMSGGVGTGGTMAMARQHTGGLGGRANFIRNEGRLRGEAMKAFGGLGTAMVAKNWLESQGKDMDAMDDRSMLFFQRKFGVGRDEADQMIKMARNMDTILAQRQKSQENDQYLRRADQADRASKPEEIVKRLEMARNEINDGLREVGASFYKSMATSIGEFMGKMSGEYVQRRRAAMAGIVNQMLKGGPGTDSMMAKELGIVKGAHGYEALGGQSAGSKAIGADLFGDSKLSGAQFNRFLGSNAQRFRDAGYDITGAKSMGDVNAIQQQAFQAALGFSVGGSKRGGEGFDEKTQAAFGALAGNGIKGYGAEFTKSFETILGQLDTSGGKMLARKFKDASAKERGRMMSDILEKSGLKDVYADRLQAPSAFGSSAMGSKYATLDAENRAVGGLILGDRSRYGAEGPEGIGHRIQSLGGDMSLLMGGDQSRGGRGVAKATNWLSKQFSGVDAFMKDYMSDTAKGAENRNQVGGAVSDSVEAMTLGITGGRLGGWFGDKAKSLLGGATDTERQGVAEFLKGDSARTMAGTLLTGDSKAVNQTLGDISKRRGSLAGMKNRTAIEGAEMEGLQALEAMGRIRAAGGQPTKDQLAQIAQQTGYGDVASMLNASGGADATARHEWLRDRVQAFEGMGMQAQGDALASAASNKDIDASLASGDIKVSREALAYRKAAQGIRQQQTGYTGDTSEEGVRANFARLNSVTGAQDVLAKNRAGMSVAQKRKMAGELSQVGEGDEASRMAAEANAEGRLTKGLQRGSGGVLEVVAGALGAEHQKGEFKNVKGGAGVQALMERLGLGKGSNVQGREDIEKDLMAVVTGKDAGGNALSPGARGQLLASLQGRSQLQEGQKENQDKKSEGNDPSYRRLGDIEKTLGEVKNGISMVNTSLQSNLKVEVVQH